MSASKRYPDVSAWPAGSGTGLVVLIQGLVVTIALLGAMLVPPEEGPMMVIPLGGDAMAATMDWALGDGAAFMGAGPLPGSILVYGRREPITDGAWRHNSLVIKAPAIFCGTLSYPSRNS